MADIFEMDLHMVVEYYSNSQIGAIQTNPLIELTSPVRLYARQNLCFSVDNLTSLRCRIRV